MFSIEIPGKVGAVSVRFASAADAIAKYREMEADGFSNIDVKNAKGDRVEVGDLAKMASNEGADDKEGRRAQDDQRAP